jgi:hypothetical protein
VLAVAAWHHIGGRNIAIAGVITLASALLIAPARHSAVRCWELLTAPHRVRAGLVQAA